MKNFSWQLLIESASLSAKDSDIKDTHAPVSINAHISISLTIIGAMISSSVVSTLMALNPFVFSFIDFLNCSSFSGYFLKHESSWWPAIEQNLQTLVLDFELFSCDITLSSMGTGTVMWLAEQCANTRWIVSSKSNCSLFVQVRRIAIASDRCFGRPCKYRETTRRSFASFIPWLANSWKRSEYALTLSPRRIFMPSSLSCQASSFRAPA